MKRQRRKQSNRESARRSRLRKQAECEAFAVRVNELMNENVKLRAANEQLLKLQHVACHQVCTTQRPAQAAAHLYGFWHLIIQAVCLCRAMLWGRLEGPFVATKRCFQSQQQFCKRTECDVSYVYMNCETELSEQHVAA